ncbi:hypothetical protein DL546_005342 [Coniochaeta pulveracea]|uniref:Uncharacterized protein n=1 Tax=Coniochaeta pulveracea TaxID=177199 RepID=A0A420YFR0_9PEZI|nr:hypothetical protein DL546_005342 [Coniochaeta pulveracea]
MKFSTILTSALAPVSLAAPTKPVEDRAVQIDLSSLNGLNSFKAVDIQYLAQVNKLNLGLLLQLGQQNNLDILVLESLFQSQQFDLNAILQLQALQTLLAIASTGALNQFDLSSINLSSQLLQLGLIQNIGSFGFSSLIDQTLVPQIQTVAEQFITIIA